MPDDGGQPARGLREQHPRHARPRAAGHRATTWSASSSSAPTRPSTPARSWARSKALGERVVETLAQEQRATKLMSVRFGNVLGSSGSVVPIFKRQIAAGGPVTVTDERMTRYFMTIPEAVRLVLQAAALGDGGEIFVLDMGEPVQDRRPGARDDPPLRPGAGPRHRHRVHRRPPRARSCTSGSSTRARRSASRHTPRSAPPPARPSRSTSCCATSSASATSSRTTTSRRRCRQRSSSSRRPPCRAPPGRAPDPFVTAALLIAKLSLLGVLFTFLPLFAGVRAGAVRWRSAWWRRRRRWRPRPPSPCATPASAWPGCPAPAPARWPSRRAAASCTAGRCWSAPPSAAWPCWPASPGSPGASPSGPCRRPWC